MKQHGGVLAKDLQEMNVAAVVEGLSNLHRHISNISKFGVPVVVALNRFTSDTDEEISIIKNSVNEKGVDVIECNHWSDGSAGVEDLAYKVADLADSGDSKYNTLYPDDMGLFYKINIITKQIYGASEAIADKSIRDLLLSWESKGYKHFPICMAKTQYSFSTDPNLKGAPVDHVVPIREVRLSAGAEFIVAICGQIMTRPGLPKTPAANNIGLDEDGLVKGLF